MIHTYKWCVIPHPKKLPGGKIPLALALGIVSLVYAVWKYSGGGPPLTSGYLTAVPPTVSTSTIPAVVVQHKPQKTSSAPQPRGLYADGSYTGTAADAFYGTVQVQAIIQNGALTDVTFLQHPSDRSTSVALNNQAMPILTQEAIAAQSANVDIVSGATFTSQAFQQSLASALVLAQN